MENVGRGNCGHFRNKKGKCLGGKFNKIGTKYMKGNFTDLHKNRNGFKKRFRPRIKSVVDVNGHLQRISYANC